jgi:phage-related minor tail protein
MKINKLIDSMRQGDVNTAKEIIDSAQKEIICQRKKNQKNIDSLAFLKNNVFYKDNNIMIEIQEYTKKFNDLGDLRENIFNKIKDFFRTKQKK